MTDAPETVPGPQESGTPRAPRPRVNPPANPVVRAINALDRGLARLEAVILAGGVLLMAVNSIGNVIGRQVFGQSLYFAEEVNRFLIVLITFAGLAYAARRARHIRMTALYDTLGDGPKKALTVAISVVTAILMFGLAYYAYVYVAGIAASGRPTPALRIPLWITYAWIPVGLAVTGVQYLQAALKNLMADGVWLSSEEEEGYADPAEATSV